jgi:hypothetical protein
VSRGRSMMRPLARRRVDCGCLAHLTPLGHPQLPARTIPASPANIDCLFELTVPATQEGRGHGLPSAPVVGRGRLQASRERVVAGQSPVGHWDLAPPGDAELLP